MPKGYIIFTEDVKDQDGITAYVGKALPTILQKGGKPIVFDQNVDTIEGAWHGTQTVVLEFDSVEAAREWYKSDEYQAVIGERHAAADCNAAIVSGFELPGS